MSWGIIRRYFVVWLCLLGGLNAAAHEVRPAFLQLTEVEAGVFNAVWKQPILDGKRLKIDPVYPEGCTVTDLQQTQQAGTIHEVSKVTCDLKTGTLRLDGLERTLTDAFVAITYLDGETRSSLLKPAATSLDLGGPVASAAPQYLRIGADHILMGWDHLLFVIGLTLLVARRQIWGVATAFTAAHSLTLALAAFGWLSVPSRPVEILIAASIVLLGIEIIRKHREKESLATRKPYLISFMIGLIHGCGFASALADIGLPKGTEILALLLFNVGVELGQFGIVAIVLLCFAGLAKINMKTLRRAEVLTTYAIGTVAMYWLIERMAQYLV